MMLARGELSAGHARALLTSENPVKLANTVLSQGLSVRQTEALAKRGVDQDSKPSSSASTKRSHKDADTRALEADLSANLGLQVVVDHKGHDGGELRIRYKTLDDLDGLCQRLSR
jgi:ParB family chromosome partitioning protein